MAGEYEQPEGIVTKLRRVEVLHGQGMSMVDAVWRNEPSSGHAALSRPQTDRDWASRQTAISSPGTCRENTRELP